jgi:hypothetical protein
MLVLFPVPIPNHNHKDKELCMFRVSHEEELAYSSNATRHESSS